MDSSKRLDPLIEPAVDVLRRLFQHKDDEISPVDIGIARLAASTISAWSRLKQTETAQEAVHYSMARDLAGSPEQLAEYIKLSMPHVPIVTEVLSAKKLPAKTKE